jgi:hypothetical protein
MPVAAKPATGNAPIRGTQSFVYTLSACWRRPSLTALEVLWRWAFGIPALALVYYEATRILQQTPIDTAALSRMSLFDPMSAASTLSDAAALILPLAVRAAAWLAPLLLLAWIVISALGRTAVLRRLDPRLHPRPRTLMLLQAVRILALAAAFALWYACIHAAAHIAVNAPIAQDQEPSPVLFSALAIIATLGLFTLWAVVSWGLSVAPLLAMLRNLGAPASLAQSFHLGPLRSKLVEINLVMGIVKIALIVLAMVLSACPLPFESVATPQFMAWWYAAVTVLYLLASDLFHVVQLASYLALWKVYAPNVPPS